MPAYLDKWISSLRRQLDLADAMPDDTAALAQAKHDQLDQALSEALRMLRATVF